MADQNKYSKYFREYIFGKCYLNPKRKVVYIQKLVPDTKVFDKRVRSSTAKRDRVSVTTRERVSVKSTSRRSSFLPK